MECEFWENYFCATCLQMTDDDYDYHAKSTAMWFCAVCKPKVKETLKIEKENERNQNDNSNEEHIIEQVNKQFQAKTMAEIVKQQM